MSTHGFQFRVGVSLVLGLTWASAALGDRPLFPGAQYAAGIGPESAAIGDLNGDQVPDLAVANLSDSVSVLLGLGDGTFAAAVQYGAGTGPFSVAIADLDGDQALDLVVANLTSDDVSVPLNQRPPAPPPLGDLNCDGAFNGGDIDPFFLALGDPAAYTAQFPNCDILLGDMNGDGSVNGGDIDPFFACLGGGVCP